jgi:hypothetical protein
MLNAVGNWDFPVGAEEFGSSGTPQLDPFSVELSSKGLSSLKSLTFKVLAISLQELSYFTL